MRGLVAALLVANLLFFAWSQGLLEAVIGLRPGGEREPERLAQQVRPELIRVIEPPAAAREARPASAAAATPPEESPAAPATPTPANATPGECLQAGPFTVAEAASAEARLQAVVPGLETARFVRSAIEPLPPVWAVYIGRFGAPEGVRLKREELARLRIDDAEDLLEGPPEFVPGLVLGRFDSRAAAQAGLARFEQRGVRTARVVQLSAGGAREVLRLEAAPPPIAAQVRAVGEGPFAGHRFLPCEAAAGR